MTPAAGTCGDPLSDDVCGERCPSVFVLTYDPDDVPDGTCQSIHVNIFFLMFNWHVATVLYNM